MNLYCSDYGGLQEPDVYLDQTQRFLDLDRHAGVYAVFSVAVIRMMSLAAEWRTRGGRNGLMDFGC